MISIESCMVAAGLGELILISKPFADRSLRLPSDEKKARKM